MILLFLSNSSFDIQYFELPYSIEVDSTLSNQCYNVMIHVSGSYQMLGWPNYEPKLYELWPGCNNAIMVKLFYIKIFNIGNIRSKSILDLVKACEVSQWVLWWKCIVVYQWLKYRIMYVALMEIIGKLTHLLVTKKNHHLWGAIHYFISYKLCYALNISMA